MEHRGRRRSPDRPVVAVGSIAAHDRELLGHLHETTALVPVGTRTELIPSMRTSGEKVNAANLAGQRG